jgi:hypothetical protein
MLQSYYLFILTLAMVAHSAPRHQTPEEWAREQNDQRFNRDAYDGLPWEEYSKQGFSPRKPPRRLRLADSDRQRAFRPTLTSDDFAPTRTHAMSLMRRAPQATFTCNPGANCYTFNCKFLGPHPSFGISSWKRNHVLTAAVGPTSVQVSLFNASLP